MHPKVRKAAKAIAATAGVQITRNTAEQHDRHAQRRILIARHNVSLVLDIGANVGQYRDRLRNWTGYVGRIASFEPGERAYRDLAQAAIEDSAWDTFPYGLSDREATIDIYIPEGLSDLASLAPMTSVGMRMMDGTPIVVTPVGVRRLDDVIGEVERPGDSILLKIDVQGHEKAVIDGAAETLARVAIVECELPLMGIHEREGTFAEMLRVLAEHRFRPVGMFTNYVDPMTGVGVDADVFFVRSDLFDH